MLQAVKLDSSAERVNTTQDVPDAVEVRLAERNYVKRIGRERALADGAYVRKELGSGWLQLLAAETGVTVATNFIFRLDCFGC